VKIVWGCHMLRRHSCSELGFDWIGAFTGCESRELAKEYAERSIENRARVALIAVPRSQYKLHLFKYNDDDSAESQIEQEELNALRKFNKPFMDERKAAIARGHGRIFRNLPEEVQA
jgi:hypothetical protein